MSHLNGTFRLHAVCARGLLLALLVLFAIPASAALVRTGYGPLIAEHSGQCLDTGRIGTDSAAIAQWDCLGLTNQQWAFQRSAGAFLVVNLKSKRCLAVRDGSTEAGAAVIQTACKNPGRLWNIMPSDQGVQLVARHSGLCVDVQSAGLRRGTPLVQGPCAAEPDKRFIIGGGFVAPTTRIMLIDRLSGMCVAVSATGASVEQQPCAPASNVQWTLEPDGTNTGTFRIVSTGGVCLSINAASTAPGTALVPTACTGAAAEQWLPRAQAKFSYQFVSNLSKRCLDIAGASMASGTALVESTCSTASTNQHWSLAFPTPRSSWSNLITVEDPSTPYGPIVPVAVANLPNGKVLAWSAYLPLQFTGTNRRQSYTAILDPATGEVTASFVTQTKHDMFCPGTSNLPDGRILVSGGSTSDATSLFDPFETLSNAWSTRSKMTTPRAYQGNTVLSSGNVFTLGGSWAGGIGNKGGELYSVASDAWAALPGVPLPDDSDFIGPDYEGVYRGDNHLWLFAQADGWVFHAGPSAQMHWIDTKNGGAVTPAGPRGDDVYSINGNAVLYDTGRILKLGGGPNYQAGLAYNSAYLIDIRQRPAVTVQKLAPLNFARTFANSVVLPSGEVVVIGGMKRAKLFTDQYAAFETELWDPKTQVFTKLGSSGQIAVARTYHSVALLLPDGRVLSGGGGLCADCTANHPDVQILTPPYLLNADGSAAARPTITQAPVSATVGSTVSINTDRPISELVLVRLSSTTHTVNNDQRRVKLWFQSTPTPNAYRAAIPADRGAVLPGYWMAFAMDARGVPSVARTIRIQ